MASTIKFSLSAIEARDLLASDSNGLSDPYFKIPHSQTGIIDIAGKKNRTKTIKKSINPVWNHTFDVEYFPKLTKILKIEVYDYDTLGSDDQIGSATLTLEWMRYRGQDFYDGWIPLNVTVKDKRTKTSSVIQKGSVHIKIQVKFRPEQLALNGQPPIQALIQAQI